jgi:cupin fold WbuC family metalloprotein
MRPLGNEVFSTEDRLIKVGSEEIAFLTGKAIESQRKRSRLCAHFSVTDPLHEMLIVLSKETYIRPHKHVRKTESLHVVKGEADAVFFDENGSITDIVKLGAFKSKRCFYYRIADPVYHTLILKSDFFVFHEVTNGPFTPADTLLAPWAPEESNGENRRAYLRDLKKRADDFKSGNKYSGRNRGVI